VKPPSFRYVAPRSVDEAAEQLDQHRDEAKVLAGGQSLVPLMNLRLAAPGVLVDVNRIPELAYIREWDGGVAIGAVTRQSELENDPLVAERAPLLKEAALLIGHPAIRHRGTVGGSAAHADPAAELPAVLLALDAEVTATGASGQRSIPAGELFADYLTTTLRPDELLTEVRVPGLPPQSGSAFVELHRRHGDYAIVGAAAVLTLGEDGTIRDARLAMCGVGPTPIRASGVEQALVGRRPDAATLREASALASEAASDPPSDIHGSAAYRRKMAAVFARRSLKLAAQRAGAAG
jgi:aerobic carbon-monoxide dehydrogenase medium subunit